MQRKNIYLNVIALTALISVNTGFADMSDGQKLAASGLAGAAIGSFVIRPTTQALHEHAGLSTKKSVAITAALSGILTTAIHVAAEGKDNINGWDIIVNLGAQTLAAILTLHSTPIKEVREAKQKSERPETHLDFPRSSTRR